MTQKGIPTNQRVYLLISPTSDGQTALQLSMDAPMVGQAVAAILLRGQLPGGDVTIPLVSDPAADPTLRGDPGANATDQQVAVAVSTYLNAHPPAAGKDATPPTITIGKVSTLAAGSAATVNNSGTASALVLDIGIPQGAAGSSAAATPLATAKPAALGKADAGTSSRAAREDHVHDAPGGLATTVGTITISQTATVAISAGVRVLAIALAGVVKDANYLLFPVVTAANPNGLPAGYQIQPVAICSADGVLQVTLTAPLLAINASYVISARVVRINV